MAKRSKLAIEYNWPKKVLLHRFHDRVYRWLSADPDVIERCRPYTPLHLPDLVYIDSDISHRFLLKSVFTHNLSAYVYAIDVDEVRTVIQIASTV